MYYYGLLYQILAQQCGISARKKKRKQDHDLLVSLSFNTLLCTIAIYSFPIRNKDKLSRLPSFLIIRSIQSIVSLPFELNDASDGKGPQVNISVSSDTFDAVEVHKILEFVVFLQFVFGDEMIIGGENAGGK